MLDKLKRVAREFVAFIIIILLYKMHPEMLTWNYVILASLTFTATIDGDNKITKFLSLPSLVFFGVSLSLITGLITTPLTLELVMILGYISGVKSVKKLIEKVKDAKMKGIPTNSK